MAFIQYLKFDEQDLPLPDSYDLDISDVEADSSGETEAGTTQRDVVRTGVISIAMTVWCIRCCLQYTRQLKVLAKAQQAQMRSQLLEQYHFYMDDGWISEEHMEDWENQYQAYHSLGENGILDSRRAELLKLPNRKPNKEEQDNE